MEWGRGVRESKGAGLGKGWSLGLGVGCPKLPPPQLAPVARTQRPGPAQLSVDLRPDRAHWRLWAGPQQLQGEGCGLSGLGAEGVSQPA